MRIRPIFLLLLCATGAAAQIPTLTNSANIKFVQGNTIFDRPVSDLLALVGAENITVSGNWTFSSNLTQLKDAGTYFYDDATPTKLMRFQLSGITAATTRNLTVPDADGTIALTTNSSGLTDLTASVTGTLPVANGGTGATTFTNNRLLTGNGTSAIVDEANLTFDGTTLSALTNANSATNNIVINNSNAGSSAVGQLRFWNNSSTASNRGYVSQLASSAFSSPYGSSQIHWLYENANQIWATNNSARMLLNATGLYLGSATSPSERLHVNGNAYVTGNISAGVQPALQTLHINGTSYLTGNVGIGVNPASTRLHVAGTSNATLLVESNNTVGTTFEVKNTDTGGGDFTFSVSGSANTYPVGSFIGYDEVANQTRYWIEPDGDFGITNNTSLDARLHIEGAGATSGTNTLLVENSAGTDIFTVRDDLMSAFGTTPVSTEKLLVRGATSDNTAKAFVAERSSGTDLLGVQNDGKVSINNAAYTEELTINGQAQLDGVIFTSVTGSTTASGHVVYTDNATHGGYMTIGDGDRQLALMPTMIERDVIDYNVDWTTGRKGSFWTVPARFDGWKISKVYIGITNIGSGAGDDELTIEVGGVAEGVQVVTGATHTLVMDEVVNTDDIVTFNVTAISATPAKGLNVALELAKN